MKALYCSLSLWGEGRVRAGAALPVQRPFANACATVEPNSEALGATKRPKDFMISDFSAAVSLLRQYFSDAIDDILRLIDDFPSDLGELLARYRCDVQLLLLCFLQQH